MSLDADAMYALLPAVYRTRDAASGGQLRGLLQVMAAEFSVVEDNINQLYDDQFIETCAPWVIPYIADLIGYNSVYEVAAATSDSRAEVANTVGYRRRKGTLLALEQVTADISGRGTLVVEQFRALITTQSMRHTTPDRAATVAIRDAESLAVLDTAFDITSRSIDVRRIAPRVRAAADPDPTPLDIALHGPGRFNIPDVAIHLWRWQSWQVNGAPATQAGSGRYRFSQLGHDMPLFSVPQARAAFTSLTTRADLPLPIRRRELASFYGPQGSILLVADGVAVDATVVYPANLGDRPGGSWCTVADGMIAIDTELGRIQYGPGLTPPADLTVSYAYGFPAAIAGGPYDRTLAMSELEPAGPGFAAVVGTGYPTLAAAVAEWNSQPPGTAGLIVVPGFVTLTTDLTGAAAVTIPAGSSLVMAAADAHDLTWTNSRPVLVGDIEVSGAGQFQLNGIWVAGQLRMSGTGPVVGLSDCTLVPGLGLLPDGEPVSPGEPSIVITAEGASLSLDRVISGPVAADPSGTSRVRDSILDATSAFHPAYAGPDLASAGADLDIEGSTVIGKVHTRTFTLASNCIFHASQGRDDPWAAPVWASRQQSGCVRFCALPAGSITPRRYRCLPPDGSAQALTAPAFVMLSYGQPGYGLLSGDVPVAVWTGADNGSQPGAYRQLQETEAVTNVALRAPEYLPALLESGIFIHPSRQPAAVPAVGHGYYPILGIGAGLI